MSSKQLAWIGLGNIGRAMVTNIVTRCNLSQPFIVYNRTKKRSDDLNAALSSALSVASSISEAVVPADIIFSCISDDKSVNSTFEEILRLDVKGKLFVECSTIHPTTTSALTDAVLAKGARLVAMPVFGAPAMAEAGNLVCVPSGPAVDVDAIRPYLVGVTARAIVDFSDHPPSKASLLKIVGNTMTTTVSEMLAEAYMLAEKSGLGTDALHKFIEIMFTGPYIQYSTRMLSGDYYKREEPLGSVDIVMKDVNHALELAKETGSELRIPAILLENLKVVKELQGAKGDLTGVYGVIRTNSGLSFENQDKAGINVSGN